MSEATILKPTPGGRKNSSAAGDEKHKKSAIDDGTMLVSTPHVGESGAYLLKFGDNPLIEEAGILLSMIGQIRCTPSYDNVSMLRQICIDKIKTYESALRIQHVSTENIESARYCLCCSIDEAVLNTSWGAQSVWAGNSLLSTFHAQTWGGEYFYTLLDNNLASPRSQIQLIELQYLCLSLGFVGKMRLEERGETKLEDYRQQAYECLLSVYGEIEGTLSTNCNASDKRSGESYSGVPLWVTVSLFGGLLLSIYMGCSYFLNDYSDNVFNRINQLVHWEHKQSSQTTLSDVKAQIIPLEQRLQTEIEKGLLTIQPMDDRVRITINAQELFAPGSADIKPATILLVQKISRVLESTTGRILISGHTDSQPIFTSRYPSNWHLSLARANAVANLMSVGTRLQGRLWPEGRGDSEPLASNDTSEGRAKNRRVEIDLLF